MEKTDSLSQDILLQFQMLAKLKDDKYVDMKSSWSEYNQYLKKQTRKTTGALGALMGGTIVIGVILLVFLHK